MILARPGRYIPKKKQKKKQKQTKKEKKEKKTLTKGAYNISLCTH
jgi:hypothetical protein